MSKVGAVIIVVVVLIACNIFLLVVWPVITDIVNTANTTMAATTNMSNYPGASETMVATPWLLYFVPNVIGMIIIVGILKSR